MPEEQDELKKTLGELFDAACNHHAYSPTRTFTSAERDKFLDQVIELTGRSLLAADPTWLTKRLLKTEGKFESAQERAKAILQG